jgi:site-specific DNA recombinase
MYVDKLDGRVDAAFFDQMSALWRAEQEQCLRSIEQHQSADQAYLDEGIRILELAQNARRLFEQREAREKRRLLNFVVSNCSWKGGELNADFRQPFDLIVETAAEAARAGRVGRAEIVDREIWLGFEPRLTESESPEVL